MEKKDLIPGQHGVESRDGDRYIVAHSDYSRKPFLLGNKSYTGLDGYKDNLRHGEHSTLDIVKVFTLRESSLKFQRLDEDTIWEEGGKQACESKIDAAQSKIGLHKYKIECLEEDIEQLKSQLNNKETS